VALCLHASCKPQRACTQACKHIRKQGRMHALHTHLYEQRERAQGQAAAQQAVQVLQAQGDERLAVQARPRARVCAGVSRLHQVLHGIAPCRLHADACVHAGAQWMHASACMQTR